MAFLTNQLERTQYEKKDQNNKIHETLIIPHEPSISGAWPIEGAF